ncbi:MAG: TRAP transporter small permease [Desulfobacteraceae bacterium]|nr:TRAP transporter small permease [Desulfobacteraceae bacterium]
MPAIENLEKLNNNVIRVLEWVGLAGLIVMMSITCVNVIGAKVFRNPVLGALDIVVISQLTAISFAVAGALIQGRHVAVEFFVMILPKRIEQGIAVIINLLGLFLFIVIVYRLFLHAGYLWEMNEVTPTARIPLYPFVYAAAVAFIPVCIVYLFELIKSISLMVKK